MRKSNLDEENNEVVNQKEETAKEEQPAEKVVEQANGAQEVKTEELNKEKTPFDNPIYDEVNPSRLQHDNHNDNRIDKFGNIEEKSEERPEPKKRMNPKLKAVLEWVYCIIIAVVIAIVIKYFIGAPTVVRQESMDPTLKPGDRLILNRICRTFHQEYEKGDIITFTAPSNDSIQQTNIDQKNPVAKYENEPTNPFESFVYYVLEIGKTSFIKRVVATAGDHVVIKDGKVFVNGHQLVEDYLPAGTETFSENYNDFVVPEGYVFAVGDNRSVSLDCRAFGCIPIDKIEGKVVLRFFPFDKFGGVD
jgi:signal peptidase I